MNFKYSIVVPHYNSLVGLERLLASIPQRSDIQVIVVDDNSKDTPDPRYFSQEFPQLNLSIYANDSGVKGAGAARNVGLKHLDSEYTIFADADDFFTQDAFSILDGKLAGNDITYFAPISQCEVTGETTDRHETWANLVKQHIDTGNEDIRFHFAVPWSKVYRTCFIKGKSLYFDQVIAWNDVMFSLVSGYKSNSIASHLDAIYCVTKGQGTITGTFTLTAVRSRFDVQMRRVEYIHSNGIQTESYSFYKMIKNFHKVMNWEDYNQVFKLLFQSKITLLPNRTYFYLKNPSQIRERFFSK